MERARRKTQHRRRSRRKFDKMTSAVFLDFKGMTVENVTKLRDEFRKAGVEYKVVKNTLVKHALKDSPYGRQARRRTRRDDRRRVELRGPERRREGRQGLQEGRTATSSRSKPASSKARCSTRKPSRTSSRRCPARTSSARCCSRRFKRRSQQFVRVAQRARAELRRTCSPRRSERQAADSPESNHPTFEDSQVSNDYGEFEHG